jgi:hypothetical protein
MMVNSDIIHLCTSLKKIFHGESIKLPEEVHHIIMLPINFSPAPTSFKDSSLIYKIYGLSFA